MPNVARPQALAELGAVVSAGVQRQIADLFVAEERGSHELKGRTRRSLRMSSPPLEASRIQRQEMSVLAKSFSAVLLALPFSLAALSDPLRPTSPAGRCRHCHSFASRPLTKLKRPLSCSGNRLC